MIRLLIFLLLLPSLSWAGFSVSGITAPASVAGVAAPASVAGIDGGGDVTAPTLVSATIPAAGTSISLLFSEAITVGAGGNAGWTIDMNGGAGETLTYDSGDTTTTFVYTIGVRKIKAGETGTVTYTQPGSGLEDAAAIDLATIATAVVTNNSTVAVTLDDSYVEANQNDSMWLGAAYVTEGGQSFTSGGGTLDRVDLWLLKSGLATGDMTVKIYAHSGTYGTSSVPTGDVLATSGAIASSTLANGVYGLISFSFTGANRINLTETYYTVNLYYAGGDSAKFVKWGQDSSSSTHDGNEFYDDSGWVVESGMDQIFYVYVVR